MPLTGRPTTRPFIGGEDEVPATSDRELAMEQYLFNLSEPLDGAELQAVVQPQVWVRGVSGTSAHRSPSVCKSERSFGATTLLGSR